MQSGDSVAGIEIGFFMYSITQTINCGLRSPYLLCNFLFGKASADEFIQHVRDFHSLNLIRPRIKSQYAHVLAFTYTATYNYKHEK